mgnify:FL=1
MKTTLGNFLTQGNKDFPVDAETFDTLQQNQAVLAVIGNLAGDKAVLCGCEPEQGGSRRRAGYAFLRTKGFPQGAVLYWEGGSVSAGMYLKKETVAVEAQGYDYPQAYVVRSLAPGIGTESYAWTSMRDVSTIPELEQTIAALRAEVAANTPPPLGVVQLWAGSSVPANYSYCDGRALAISSYPKLYAAIGNIYNNGVTASGGRYTTGAGYFRLPDLRGRFVVGQYPNGDADYNTCGKTGGEKKHTLTIAEMPQHQHGQNLWAEDSGRWRGGGDNSSPNSTSKHNQTTPFGETDMTGGGAAHENRPPYYTLAYIMRIK